MVVEEEHRERGCTLWREPHCGAAQGACDAGLHGEEAWSESFTGRARTGVPYEQAQGSSGVCPRCVLCDAHGEVPEQRIRQVVAHAGNEVGLRARNVLR